MCAKAHPHCDHMHYLRYILRDTKHGTKDQDMVTAIQRLLPCDE